MEEKQKTIFSVYLELLNDYGMACLYAVYVRKFLMKLISVRRGKMGDREGLDRIEFTLLFVFSPSNKNAKNNPL